MLRTFWVAIAAVFVTIPLSSAVIIVALFRNTSPLIDKIVRLWARSLVRAAGIDLRTENLDALEPDQRYILVANHYSYFDIPCVFAAIPQPIRFMAKQSLFKVPIFGWSIARAGFIPIDRKDRSKAKKSFDLAAERVRKGNTIVIFPEEGRSRERTMREFKSGAFLLALKSDRTIVPIAIDGTYDVYNAKSRFIRAGRVTVKVGTPLPTEGLRVRDKERLLTESRAQIQTMLFGRAEDPAPAASALPE
ncbi:MAG: 1-acyl-sn-glycerol-3-phosphate acyltransferase [Acidobacteria bacterium]|nr:MAG: 1-acyl-sn-glycerol-3-phosphate acyltransferase [Acidobacteriota bacterium]